MAARLLASGQEGGPSTFAARQRLGVQEAEHELHLSARRGASAYSGHMPNVKELNQRHGIFKRSKVRQVLALSQR